jgi:hypothetical protein
MHDGKWKLDITEELKDDRIIRDHQLITLEDSWFMDFVSRFQFKKEFFDKVIIGNRELIHRNTNLYYQYPVDEVELSGKDLDIIIKAKETITIEKFKLNMYARDYPGLWIIHARLMPKKWDNEIIKICCSWYNRAIPQRISDALLSSRRIKNFLWYRGERKQPGFPLNAYAVVKLNKGEKLQLKTEVKTAFK